MDRPTNHPVMDARSSRPDPPESIVLPSRRAALEVCRAATQPVRGDLSGPVLLTGESGMGKTWLWRLLQTQDDSLASWISVDLTPANNPLDFYRLISHELGLSDQNLSRLAANRVELGEILLERQTNGHRVNLVIEEAQNLTSDVWEEVRVLAARLARPGGFASIILVGLTSLALKFSTRALAAIEARLASRAHLGPISVDEAGDWLTRLHPGRNWSGDDLEILHRDALGNPRRLLRRIGWATPMPALAPTEPRKLVTARAEAEPLMAVAPPIHQPEPLTGPVKPPIRSEENMIEVGWSADDAMTSDEDEGEDSEANPAGSPLLGEEAVQDHYAALQAWREWTANQSKKGHSPPAMNPLAQPIRSIPSESDLDEEIEIEDDEADGVTQLPNRLDRSTVRAEGEQKFAPFGPLFSRMAQYREPE